MKLNRELTENLYNAASADAVKEIVQSGVDLLGASRLSLNEILMKFYHLKCTGTKENAVEMLIGATEGRVVPDRPISPQFQHPKLVATTIDPELKAKVLPERIRAILMESKDHFVWVKKQMLKDPELKSLMTTEDDIIKVVKESADMVVGLGNKRTTSYVIFREPAMMETLKGYGDEFLV